MKHVKLFEAFVNKKVNEALTSKSPEEEITIDLDMSWDDENPEEVKAVKDSWKKFKITVEPNGGNNGTGHDVTGKKKDILAYLQSEFYEMDDETIKEYYSELLESSMPSSTIYLKLIDEKTGKEVQLPYTTKDFRGTTITVVDFDPPRHAASSGRIYTKDGGEYFPGVAGLKIIGHEFDHPSNFKEDPNWHPPKNNR